MIFAVMSHTERLSSQVEFKAWAGHGAGAPSAGFGVVSISKPATATRTSFAHRSTHAVSREPLLFITGDFTNTIDCTKIVEKTIEHVGAAVHDLVNNAAIGMQHPGMVVSRHMDLQRQH